MTRPEALAFLCRLRALRESGRYGPRDTERLTDLALDAVIAGLRLDEPTPLCDLVPAATARVLSRVE